MLAVARALIQAPKVLLIDEMSMGLAPVVVESLLPIIRQVADESDAAVVLVEQHVQLALEVADVAIVLVHGGIVASGSADEVRREEATLAQAYLSGGTDP
jgi:branched-chain amino acid transport system ATP-binding protein